MENNNLSNGRIHHQSISTSMQRFRSDGLSKGPPELPAVESLNWLLYRYYVRREYNKCKAVIEEELQKYAGRTEYPNYLKGLLLREEGKVQDSLDYFQKAYIVNRSNVNNAKQIAKSLFLLGDHKRAVEVYMQALKMIDTEDWEIHCGLGECYIQMNEFENARSHLTRAIELTKNEKPYLALVKLYVKEDRIIDAIAVYTAALNAQPNNEKLATDLGLMYLKLGDTKRAFQQFGTALARSPHYAKAILPMAYILQSQGEFDVAFSKYKIAAQSMPESWALWNNIGMCLYGKQKYVSAITCLKKAHYLNPLALPAAYNLGLVFLATGQPASAAVYLCAAVTAAPKNFAPYMLLGLALKRLEDLDGAEKALEKAHSLAPQDPQVLINYAVVLDAQRKEERARELLVVLSDVAALVDVETGITKMAKQLASKLRAQDQSFKSAFIQEERTLTEDEV